MEFKIRAAKDSDAKQLLDIYAYYVAHSALTFECKVPSLKEFQNRVTHTLEYYPYLVAEYAGEIIGYSYAGRFQPRAAYAWNAEMTIYLKENIRRQGGWMTAASSLTGGIQRSAWTKKLEFLKKQCALSKLLTPSGKVSIYNEISIK